MRFFPKAGQTYFVKLRFHSEIVTHKEDNLQKNALRKMADYGKDLQVNTRPLFFFFLDNDIYNCLILQNSVSLLLDGKQKFH